MLKKKYFKTKEECEVTFEFDANGAQEVLLLGEFSNWEPISMKKTKSKGAPFKTKVRLPKNQSFQFRYLIDQQVWENDEAADAYWPNDQGSDNSVVFTNN
ncbi:MAG: isoamylase early set domain-containing protein [Chloroflexota bacterium]